MRCYYSTCTCSICRHLATGSRALLMLLPYYAAVRDTGAHWRTPTRCLAGSKLRCLGAGSTLALVLFVFPLSSHRPSCPSLPFIPTYPALPFHPAQPCPSWRRTVRPLLTLSSMGGSLGGPESRRLVAAPPLCDCLAMMVRLVLLDICMNMCRWEAQWAGPKHEEALVLGMSANCALCHAKSSRRWSAVRVHTYMQTLSHLPRIAQLSIQD